MVTATQSSRWEVGREGRGEGRGKGGDEDFKYRMQTPAHFLGTKRGTIPFI